MNADDFYRIRDHAMQGKAGSVFILPDVDNHHLSSVLFNAIDWVRLFSDFIDRLLAKMGSFAHDWHIEFGFEEGQIYVSQPGVLHPDYNDFMRVQNIVLRLLKLKPCSPLFVAAGWRWFNSHLQGTIKYSGTDHLLEHGTHAGMSDAQLEATVRHNYHRMCFIGRLPSIRYLKDQFVWECEYFSLDELIALHRGGVYTIPGRRVDLSWLQYANSD